MGDSELNVMSDHGLLFSLTIGNIRIYSYNREICSLLLESAKDNSRIK